MFTLVEPQWGIDLLMRLNEWMVASPALMYWIPKLADVFVFTYPVFLVLLYFWSNLPPVGSPLLVRRDKLYYKISALFIGFSVLLTVIANIFIQYVFDKVRPDVVLGLINNKTESILHKFLPSSSFPSDHAAVSMSIAMATLLWGVKNKDRRFVWMSIPLFVFSLIMSFCRITGGIHRPTDIIAGSIVGLLVPVLFLTSPLIKLPHLNPPHSVEREKLGWLEKMFLWIGKKI